MKQEIWLRTNGRAYAAAAVVPAVINLACGLIIAFGPHVAVFWLCGIGGLISLAWLVILAQRARQPRLAYRDGRLEVYLGGWRPILVPIEMVECFFLGQDRSGLPKLPFGKNAGDVATKTIVVRLAESAHDWKHRVVRPSLGLWCEGYITVLGTWSEPLGGDVVARLNRRLVEVQSEIRQEVST